MSATRLDVLTIGNAIVDILARVEDDFIVDQGLQKSIMHLIDEERSGALSMLMPDDRSQVSGGSAANTAAGVASLGGRAGFIGKVADDRLGNDFAADLAKAGVRFETARLVGGAATARSMILITPDGERTMNTYLGAAQTLNEADIDEATIGGAMLTYMEGFLWDPPEAKKAFVKAAHFAHKHERAAAFTLSDAFCIDRYRGEFRDLIKSQTMDYVFANVAELKSLYETSDFATAVRAIAADAEVAAITMGAEGAMAIAHGEIVSVKAHPVEQVVDATGAGDLFASGFLLGMARGQSLEASLSLGCLAAAEVITHIGARPLVQLSGLADKAGLAG